MFVEVVAVVEAETRQGANFTNGYRPKAFTAPPQGCNNNTHIADSRSLMHFPDFQVTTTLPMRLCVCH